MTLSSSLAASKTWLRCLSCVTPTTLFCALILLAACTLPRLPSGPDPDLQNRWLKGIPCRPPCWEGITPGVTTGDEAAEILRHRPDIVNAASVEYSPGIGLQWNWTNGVVGGSMSVKQHTQAHQTVTLIDLYRPTIKLGDVVGAYGPPDQVFTRVYREYGGLRRRAVSLFYRTQGIALFDDREARSEEPIIDASLVLQVRFFSPTDEGFKEAFPLEALNSQYLVSWIGYQSFNAYCVVDVRNPCYP